MKIKSQEIEILKYNPCKDALDFRKEYPNFKEAWQNCPRGDWMLWIAKRLKVDLRTLTLAKALCAKTVLHLMKDQRSINAVEIAERFGKGNATRQELDAAAYAAADAYAGAAGAAYAAAGAAYAAASATYDAYAAYAAASAVAYARKKNQEFTAIICREILTKEVFEKLGL